MGKACFAPIHFMQINVGILGLGTVGGGTVNVLARNRDLLRARTGCDIRIKHAATRTPSRAENLDISSDIVSSDINRVLDDPDIQVVAELIGGVEPAREYVLRAIANGKSVVTANKELIAKHGAEIGEAATKKGVHFRFEGSVAGGIPIVASLRTSLVGNRITQLMGILNGTTNYILTKMTREGLDFADVLAEAQALGYAEADPTSDVDGFDTMYKLAILANIAFGQRVSLDSILREGIRGVGARDIEYAREMGFVIKLIALARQHPNGEIELRVHPTLLPQSHPLANVNEVFNGVLVHGDAVGDVMFYGRGAGAEPTASAVVADLAEVARDIKSGAQMLQDVANASKSVEAKIEPFADVETRFCVRMQVVDRPGMLAQIATEFGVQGVSLDSIVQKKSDGETAEIFWMTHRTRQSAMTSSLQAFEKMNAVREVSSVLRVEGEA